MAEVQDTVVALITAQGDGELRAQVIIDALADLKTPEHETLFVSHVLLEVLAFVDQSFHQLDSLRAPDGSTVGDALRASIRDAAARRAAG